MLRSENLYTAHRHLDVGACCTYAETTGVGHGDPQTEAYRTVSIRKWDFWNLAKSKRYLDTKTSEVSGLQGLITLVLWWAKYPHKNSKKG